MKIFKIKKFFRGGVDTYYAIMPKNKRMEFDPKKILDDLYITYGPKGGTKLLNLLEDVLKRKDK